MTVPRTVKLFVDQFDAFDDLQLVRSLLRGYGWTISDFSSERMPYHQVTAEAYNPGYMITVDYDGGAMCGGRWSRLIRVHWLHQDRPATPYRWPIAGDQAVPPLDTILDTNDPVASEAQLAELCGVVDLRDVA